MLISIGDVWLANFPLEENPAQFLLRPVIVLDVETLEVLCVKVTKTEPRPSDEYDTPIVYWKEANLRFKSTARISKTIYIRRSQLENQLGVLHPNDLKIVQELFIKFIGDQ